MTQKQVILKMSKCTVVTCCWYKWIEWKTEPKKKSYNWMKKKNWSPSKKIKPYKRLKMTKMVKKKKKKNQIWLKMRQKKEKKNDKRQNIIAKDSFQAIWNL